MVSRSWYRLIALLAVVACIVPFVVSCASAPAPTASPTTAAPTAVVSPTTPAVTPAPGSAPASLEGQWEGLIKVACQDIGIVVRFQGSGSDSDLKAWLDIPAQSVKDNVLTSVKSEGSKIHFEAFGGARNAIFDGERAADSSLAGKFSQAGYEGTFTLKRKATVEPTPVTGPATPNADPPYDQKEVTFKHDDVTLGGTLTVPHMGGPFPAVILISGSGQQNRDEEIFGFKPFALIADYFTRNGIAVLRYDDRGIGASTGDTVNATSADFALDAQAAVNYLKTLPYINPKQIGLMGHSEGGIIAPMVAVNSPDVAYIILLAGPGVRGELLLQRQAADVLKSSGASQAEIDQTVATQKRYLEVLRTGNGRAEMEAELRAQIRKQIEAMTEEQRKALGADIDKAIEDAVQQQFSPWITFFVTYDPAPTLAKVQAPVLALFGGKDMQVAAEPNEQGMKAAFAQGNNSRVTFKTYATANHLFQPATTGSVSEYSTLKEFVPGLLDDTVKWIKDTLKGA